ncbi:tellurite resistance TerB family protein [Methanofollis fontis]|uniref:Tellurite resistance protein TerB n=1 Tax=Methanofollis fontis TaxID=2052832 RepID=A0A483CMX9_9EURY|nr:TerB N-terminal domain-containing protein [Methanofollis fontis]TAJ43982.1 hypothetical protein CUJ86_08020 [Methanofollis fontis]
MLEILIIVLIVLILFGLFLFIFFRALQTRARKTSQNPENPEKTQKDWGTKTPPLTADDRTDDPVFSSGTRTRSGVGQTKEEARTEIAETSQKNVLLWAGKQTSITVQGYTIEDPLTYWSHGTVSPDEASCLDITLPTGQSSDSNTPSLPYWPCYSQLTPDQRANYLSWLSTGKDKDLGEIGYAFIYFYGLERRALIEKKDIDLVVHEVRRLLDRYQTSHSFTTYLEGFLGYIVAMHLDTMTQEDLTLYFPDLTELNETTTLVALAWFALKGEPIPWKLAYSVARHYSGASVPSAIKKENSYFKTLFQKRYLSMFDNGLRVVPAKNPYKLEYRPASPSLLSSSSSAAPVPCFIPHPLRRKKQFNGLFSLWEGCIHDIRPFINQFSKSGGTITWKAYGCMPEELRAVTSHPDQDAWDHLFREHRKDNPWARVPVSSLAEVIGIERRHRLTPVQSRNLSRTVHDGGYVLLPHIQHAGNGYQWDEDLMILPVDDQNALSPSFASYALMLELGIGIAASDGHVDPEEREHLHTFFKETFSLSPFEYQCLDALEDLYIQTPPSLTRLGKRLNEGLDPDARLLVAQFLVDMATADGTVDPKEKKNLNRIFKAMDIEEGYLHWLLSHAENVDAADVPVAVHSGVMFTQGENLPPPVVETAPSPVVEPPSLPAVETPPVLTIDKGAVSRIMDETRDVSEILGEVFKREETELGVFVFEGEESTEEITAKETPRSDHDGIEGLQSRYVPILEELLTTEVWTRDEFIRLVQCHHCMPQATIEAINVWSEEHLGDFILEDDEGSVIVDQSMIPL